MKLRLILLFMAVAEFISINAADRRPAIFVNADVTTHIVMPEQLKMVDISTNMIAGDQCTDNMVRQNRCLRILSPTVQHIFRTHSSLAQ